MKAHHIFHLHFILKFIIFRIFAEEDGMERLDEREFVPYGSLALFGLIILLTILVWLGSYILMLKRG